MHNRVNRVQGSPVGGTGLLAIFVDLDDKDQAGFRPFLAEDMFPPRRNIGFGPLGSFDRVSGVGQQFLTLYITPTLGDLYGPGYQGLRVERGERDAAYHHMFRNQDRYVAAWTGPEISPAVPDVLASYLYVDRIDIPPADVQGFNIWFACEYLPSMAALPGVVSVRRYLAAEGSPANIVLHELSDASVTQEAAWLERRAELSAATSALYTRQL